MTSGFWFASSCVALISFFIFGFASKAPAASFTRGTETAKKLGLHEIELTGDGDVPNPFETDCAVTFAPPSGADNAVTVKAFYDGGNTWRARLYVSEIGTWTWSSASSDAGLNDKSGSFEARDSDLRGKLRKHPDNNRQWITDDGRTFLNLSDTAYTLFRSPNNSVQAVADETFQEYVKDNAALGITSMRAGGCGGYAGWSRSDVYHWSKKIDQPYDRTNWCWEKDYGQSGYWETFDLDRFQTTDRRMEWLLNNYPDMYIQLIMFGKIWTGLAERWFEIPQANREKTMDYMVARWSAFPQIYYLLLNDTNHRADNTDNMKMIREIGNYIAKIKPFETLVSAGVKRRVDSPFVLQSDWDNWHTYLHIEKYAEIDASVCEYYYDENGYNIPVHLFYGEDWYESGYAEFKDVRYYYRRMFWSVLLSGGSPNYGGRYPVIQPYHKTGEIPFPIQGGVCTDQLVGLNDNIHIKNFFEERGIDLALFAPDDGATEAIPAPSPEPNGSSRAQCARRDHEEYLIYLPCASDGEMSGGDEDSDEQQSRCYATLDTSKTPSVRVDMRNASGKFHVEWYRPTNGVSETSSPVEGGDFRTLTSPWQGIDVVLRLAKDGFTAKGNTSGVRLAEAGTERVYFTHNDKPLLSFGGQGDFIFYLAEDAYDYKRWADWAAAHGINHIRAYPPLSWTYIEKMTRICEGSEANMLFPYRETSPGSRKFDLTQFDDAYWKRFRAQCEYLQSRGIIIHLLMCSGFHTRRDAHQWPGSFFNPVNNVNDFTDHLPAKSPGRKYYVLEEGKEELAEAQKAWFRKVIKETHDLDNVYYDLVHEIGMHEVELERLKLWIETMALTTRQCWEELEPEKPIVLGMDSGEFPGLKRTFGIVGMPEPGSPMDWMFSRPYFDVLIYGYGHYVHNAWEWRKKYKKPYIGQECWDEDYQSHRYHSGYTYFHPEDRVHARKYMWKFMMAKCQQMDMYIKTLGSSDQWGKNEPFLNYDPNGWNEFEDDALILRQFWNSLVDYPNLWNNGAVWNGPGRHQYILSSPAEAVIYCSSGTREEGVRFKRDGIHIAELALADGHYTAEIIQPAAGIIKTETVEAKNGALRVRLPDFTDDIAVHVYRLDSEKMSVK